MVAAAQVCSEESVPTTLGLKQPTWAKVAPLYGIWFCRTLQWYQMGINQHNNMDRVWDTSKYHLKSSVRVLKVTVIQGHKV